MIHADLKEDGAYLVDGIQKATTHQCPHCGGHFLKTKGNFEFARANFGQLATEKIFCSKCGQDTCGRKCCDPKIACIPQEAMIEHLEGKTVDKYEQEIRYLKNQGGVLI